MKFKFAFILLIIFSSFCLNIFANKKGKDLVKTYHSEYAVNKSTVLIMVNKYGDVDIQDWDKEKLSIDVVVKVNNKKKEKAERIFEKIDIQFFQNGNEISAVTKINGNINEDFSINYTVKMPKYVSVDLKNKFGSIFISELTGNVKIDLKYGNLKIKKLLNEKEENYSNISLSFSDCKIDVCKNANLNIKYSNFSVEKSGILNVGSKFSKFKIEKANIVISETKHDTYKLEEVNNFVSVGKFTSYKIENLHKKLDVDSEHGNLKVKNVSEDFQSIELNCKYSDIKIGINKNSNYYLEADLDYCGIDYKKSENIKEIEEETSLKVIGNVGSKENPISKIKIYSKYGDIDLEY